MRLALMQPYLFPYIGYFSLMARCDRWITFDQAQFIKGGWIQRNRILHPSEGWQWFGVPLAKHSSSATIAEVEVAPDGWQDKLLRRLDVYRRAPYHDTVAPLVETCLRQPATHIIDLAESSQRLVAEHLGLAFEPERLSELDLDHAQIQGPGDWGLEVCRQLGASTYVNAIGGRDLFDPAAFAAAGVGLEFVRARLSPYDQGGRDFEPGLSIIDVLMWNGPDEARRLVEDDVELV